MSLLETVRDKVIAGVAALLVTGSAYVANENGLMPVTEKRLKIEGFYQKRDRLLDRVEDGTITDYQRGVLSGLCLALNIAQADCYQRTNH